MCASRSSSTSFNGVLQRIHNYPMEPIGSKPSHCGELVAMLRDGTPEIKQLLERECELRYNCKVCGSILPTVRSFIVHKRQFCPTKHLEFQKKNVAILEKAATLVALSNGSVQTESDEAMLDLSNPLNEQLRYPLSVPGLSGADGDINSEDERDDGADIVEAVGAPPDGLYRFGGGGMHLISQRKKKQKLIAAEKAANAIVKKRKAGPLQKVVDASVESNKSKRLRLPSDEPALAFNKASAVPQQQQPQTTSRTAKEVSLLKADDLEVPVETSVMPIMPAASFPAPESSPVKPALANPTLTMNTRSRKTISGKSSECIYVPVTTSSKRLDPCLAEPAPWMAITRVDFTENRQDLKDPEFIRSFVQKLESIADYENKCCRECKRGVVSAYNLERHVATQHLGLRETEYSVVGKEIRILRGSASNGAVVSPDSKPEGTSDEANGSFATNCSETQEEFELVPFSGSSSSGASEIFKSTFEKLGQKRPFQKKNEESSGSSSSFKDEPMCQSSVPAVGKRAQIWKVTKPNTHVAVEVKPSVESFSSTVPQKIESKPQLGSLSMNLLQLSQRACTSAVPPSGAEIPRSTRSKAAVVGSLTTPVVSPAPSGSLDFKANVREALFVAQKTAQDADKYGLDGKSPLREASVESPEREVSPTSSTSEADTESRSPTPPKPVPRDVPVRPVGKRPQTRASTRLLKTAVDGVETLNSTESTAPLKLANGKAPAIGKAEAMAVKSNGSHVSSVSAEKTFPAVSEAAPAMKVNWRPSSFRRIPESGWKVVSPSEFSGEGVVTLVNRTPKPSGKPAESTTGNNQPKVTKVAVPVPTGGQKQEVKVLINGKTQATLTVHGFPRSEGRKATLVGKEPPSPTPPVKKPSIRPPSSGSETVSASSGSETLSASSSGSETLSASSETGRVSTVKVEEPLTPVNDKSIVNYAFTPQPSNGTLDLGPDYPIERLGRIQREVLRLMDVKQMICKGCMITFPDNRELSKHVLTQHLDVPLEHVYSVNKKVKDCVHNGSLPDNRSVVASLLYNATRTTAVNGCS